MWDEMSYNKYNFTFLEKLESEPDFDDKNVSLYSPFGKLAVIQYVEKVTRGEDGWD